MIQEQAGLAYHPLERTDLAEQAYRALREAIFRRQIAPGEKISVGDVARQLGISRTPVTESLQRLAREGLVEIVPQRGTFVTKLRAHELAELFDIRLMIELYAAEVILAGGKTAQFLADAQRAMDKMKGSMVNGTYGDYEAFIDADQDLHTSLVKLAGNEHLVEIYRNLNVHVHIARAHYMNSVERAYQAYQEHEVILDAFGRGEWAAVRRALTTHIENVRDRLLNVVERYGDSS